MATPVLSRQTQKNWWIDASLFSSAVIAALSGIYFLFVPSGGFQGGRNPSYNIQILFSRHIWDNLHTWTGTAMIAAAIIHLGIHWPWFVGMARRIGNEITGKCGCMNSRGRWNLILNIIVAVSFVLTASSGIYFLFVPGGRRSVDPAILFSRTTWDLLHTWAGITLIVAAIIHFAIHWKWVTKVTRKMIAILIPAQPMQQSTITNNP